MKGKDELSEFEFRGRQFGSEVDLSAELIGGVWKISILWRLKERVWRYGELKKSLGRITHRKLTEQLRELERDGLLVRTVFPVVPPKVEYSLSDLGRTAIPVIQQLHAWGSAYRQSSSQPESGGDGQAS